MGVSQSNTDISSHGIRAGLACFNGCDRQTVCHFLYVFVFDHAFIKGITLRRNLNEIFRQDEDMIVDDDLSFVFIISEGVIRLACRRALSVIRLLVDFNRRDASHPIALCFSGLIACKSYFQSTFRCVEDNALRHFLRPIGVDTAYRKTCQQHTKSQQECYVSFHSCSSFCLWFDKN